MCLYVSTVFYLIMPHVRTHQKQTCLSKLYTQSIQRGEKTRIGWYWWALPASCWRLPFRFFMISMPRFRDCGRKHIQTASIQVCGRIMQRFKECIKTGTFRFHTFMSQLQAIFQCVGHCLWMLHSCHLQTGLAYACVTAGQAGGAFAEKSSLFDAPACASIL